MDLIKKLTGKIPSEYEVVAKDLVNNSDVELFAKLVKQDDFLYDFIKENVARRIQQACTKENYLNLLKFFEYYSPYYDTMIARVLHSFSGDELLPEMKEIFINGTDSAKSYAAKYFSFVQEERLLDFLPFIRKMAKSNYEPLALNSIEVLSKLNDVVSKNEALELLMSEDEFEQFNAIKFLVNYGAQDSLDKIIEAMKTSSLSENIASEIPYLIPIEDLLQKDFDSGILVLCNIINSIPEIISASAIIDYNLYDILNGLDLNSSSAVLLRLAKQKFEELTSNEEYLFDSDKNTKEEVKLIKRMLDNFDNHKLKSLFYDELYEGSDFVFFALDFVDEIEELEALLDSTNQTLLLKVLTMLKDKNSLTQNHKEKALKNISCEDIKKVIAVL